MTKPTTPLDALEFIAESHDAGRHDGLPEPCPAHSDIEMWSIAREALPQAEQQQALIKELVRAVAKHLAKHDDKQPMDYGDTITPLRAALTRAKEVNFD